MSLEGTWESDIDLLYVRVAAVGPSCFFWVACDNLKRVRAQLEDVESDKPSSIQYVSNKVGT